VNPEDQSIFGRGFVVGGKEVIEIVKLLVLELRNLRLRIDLFRSGDLFYMALHVLAMVPIRLVLGVLAFPLLVPAEVFLRLVNAQTSGT
jgi:hypothetical protein